MERKISRTWARDERVNERCMVRGVRMRLVSIDVGAQSTLGGKTFLTEKIMHELLTKWANFTRFLPKNYQNILIFMIFAWQINKIPEFYIIFAPKCPNFTQQLPEKNIFSRFFLGGGTCPRPPSPTPMLVSWQKTDDAWLTKWTRKIRYRD